MRVARILLSLNLSLTLSLTQEKVGLRLSRRAAVKNSVDGVDSDGIDSDVVDSDSEVNEHHLKDRRLQTFQTSYFGSLQPFQTNYNGGSFGMVLPSLQSNQFLQSSLQNHSYLYTQQNPWRTYEVERANAVDYTKYVNNLNHLYRNQNALLNRQHAYQRYIGNRNADIYGLYNQQYSRQQLINNQLDQQRVLANQLTRQEAQIYQQQGVLNNLLGTRQKQIYDADHLQAGIVRAQQYRAGYDHLLYHRKQQELYLRRVSNSFGVQLQQYDIYLKNLNAQNSQLVDANNVTGNRINGWISNINNLRANVVSARSIANERLGLQRKLRVELGNRQQLAVVLERQAQAALVTRNRIVDYYDTIGNQIVNYNNYGTGANPHPYSYSPYSGPSVTGTVPGLRYARASALQQLNAQWLNAQHAQYANWMRWYTGVSAPANAVPAWNQYLGYAIRGNFPSNYALPWADVIRRARVGTGSGTSGSPFYVQYPGTSTIFYPGSKQGYTFGQNYVYPGAGNQYEGIGGMGANFLSEIEGYFTGSAGTVAGHYGEYQNRVGLCGGSGGSSSSSEFCFVPQQQILASELDRENIKIGLGMAQFETQYVPCVDCN